MAGLAVSHWSCQCGQWAGPRSGRPESMGTAEPVECTQEGREGKRERLCR